MTKVSGELRISIDADCPKCSESINLLHLPQFRGDYYALLTDVIFGANGMGCEDLGEQIKCPYCDKEFTVGEIVW